MTIRQPTIFLDLMPAPTGMETPNDTGLPTREQEEQSLWEEQALMGTPRRDVSR